MAEQVRQIRDLHCTIKVIHLSIVSLNLAYHILNLLHNRGGKPNSTIKCSAPSFPAHHFQPWAQIYLWFTFHNAQSAWESHTGPSRAERWIVHLSIKLLRTVRRERVNAITGTYLVTPWPPLKYCPASLLSLVYLPHQPSHKTKFYFVLLWCKLSLQCYPRCLHSNCTRQWRSEDLTQPCYQ